MTIEEYFEDWMEVIDKAELIRVSVWLSKQNPVTLCPSHANVFKAFTLCSYKGCKVVFIGQDPYPQKGVATGVLFGNNKDTPEDKLSPSLDVIKEASVNYEIPHQELVFDNTLESWCSQGILMLNSALTCKVNEIGSHVLNWRQFMINLIKNLSNKKPGLIYVLFGRQAQSLKPYIDMNNNDCIEVEHPSYFARTNTKMPNDIFLNINRILKDRNDTIIQWYQDYSNKLNINNYERSSIEDTFWYPEPL